MGRKRDRSFQPGQHRGANPSHGGAQRDHHNADHDADGRHAQNRQGEAGAGAHGTGNPNQHGINEALIAAWTRRLGIYTGVLAVATVFLVVATGISAFFIWESDQSIEGQLHEMHAQTATTRAQVRANIAAEKFQVDAYYENGAVGGWDLTPIWKNNGTTDALNLKQWWGFGFVDSPVAALAPIRCSRLPIPEGVRPLTIQAGHPYAQLAQRITLVQLQKAAAFQGVIVVQGHLDYRDIFPDDPPIVSDWCARMVPNDIPTLKVSFIDLESVTH